MTTTSMIEPPDFASRAARPGAETRTFRNEDSELRKMSEWFRGFAAGSGISEERALDFELCLNEILTNINHYAYEDARPTRDIRVTLSCEEGALAASIEDDGRPFNPVEAPPRSVTESLAETQIGGWGIPIVRALTDEVRYERRDGINRLTIVSRGGSAARS